MIYKCSFLALLSMKILLLSRNDAEVISSPSKRDIGRGWHRGSKETHRRGSTSRDKHYGSDEDRHRHREQRRSPSRDQSTSSELRLWDRDGHREQRRCASRGRHYGSDECDRRHKIDETDAESSPAPHRVTNPIHLTGIGNEGEKMHR